MGLQARLMSRALRKLTGTISKTDTAMVFINQIREKLVDFLFVQVCKLRHLVVEL